MNRGKATAAALAAAALLAVGTGTAHAATPPSQDRQTASQAWVEQQVRGLLAHNPGAERVDADSVKFASGAVMTAHGKDASAVNAVASPSSCSYYWLCMFQHSDFGGYEIQFTKCQVENLGYYKMPDGRAWNDQVSSIDNNQTSGVTTRFYNYKGSGDPNNLNNSNLVIAVRGGHYLRNLANDSSADGGSANDKIDLLRVC